MYWPKITKDTPLKKVKRIHRKIWQYVIYHHKKPHTPYICDCVACEYYKQFSIYGAEPCMHCPINWYPFKKCGQLSGDPYSEWVRTHSEESAIIIRDMPFKYESEKE